jgi:H+/gluconate symporter-like permease
MAVDRIGRVVLLGAILAALLGPAGARSEDATELAKKVQNP